ncbi:flagellar biosynthetic protein FliR [Dissulfurirhabdus thermomarina]|uniref:Flagellar biosynthetic protein FliR n=1 Tax=Dissulfurirhabdus thermomarina TaxID=1765737 RepID=A0A6N9TQH9_DISTH|nr:flagellar biosynthetic protein FliR [Dissulfurirhabdus thermomarina]NDY42710.1 flagellar biosynthetic protein FliR [Dissulfurirhabdus thermomarina]NMX24463.1 flagellar biosynthetic protein FliR [Dissulfurirhabdus thermomarina]
MDPYLLHWTTDHVKIFALLVVRIGALVYLMPIFSSRTLPVQVKAAGTLALALLFTPLEPVPAEAFPEKPLAFGLLMVAELFAGATLALVMRLLFAGVQIAGQMVGFQMGFSVANVVDPQTGAQSILMAQLAYLVALMLFVAVDGHHFFIRTLAESFTLLPPGRLHLDATLLDLVVDMGREMFVLSVKLMAPVMAILLFSQAALGILAKTVPQINLLIMSFSLNIALGLFFMGLTLQAFWPVLARALDRGVRLLPAALRLMAG